MTFNFLAKNKLTLTYALALAVLLLLLKWLEWRFIILDYMVEIYAGLVAVLFTALGIWLALKLARPKTIIIEKQIYTESGAGFIQNQAELDRTGLSAREMEVLTLMADGLSNQQIADKLFVSLNTIKTHSSNVFIKLDVQRRTQAVEKARKSGLIP